MLFPVPACSGGDSCCNEDNKCDVGEGDCDYDSDCLDGLVCGWNNCDSTGDAEWDWNDDCCYKPWSYPGKWLGRKWLV